MHRPRMVFTDNLSRSVVVVVKVTSVDLAPGP
jgi:hypothetical protein